MFIIKALFIISISLGIPFVFQLFQEKFICANYTSECLVFGSFLSVKHILFSLTVAATLGSFYLIHKRKNSFWQLVKKILILLIMFLFPLYLIDIYNSSKSFVIITDKDIITDEESIRIENILRIEKVYIPVVARGGCGYIHNLILKDRVYMGIDKYTSANFNYSSPSTLLIEKFKIPVVAGEYLCKQN